MTLGSYTLVRQVIVRDTVNARPQCAPAIQVDPFPIPKTLFPQRNTGHSLSGPLRETTLRVQFSLARLTGQTSSPSPVRAWHARGQPLCSAHLSLAQARNQYAPTSTPLAAPARSSNTNTHPIQTPTRPSRRHHCLPHHLAINPWLARSMSDMRVSPGPSSG